MGSITTRYGDTKKIGDSIGFKLDHEGKGKLVEIDNKIDWMGSRTSLIIAIAGHSHFGFERWSQKHDSYIVECDTDQVW